jgi:hypothetical protein
MDRFEVKECFGENEKTPEVETPGVEKIASVN